MDFSFQIKDNQVQTSKCHNMELAIILTLFFAGLLLANFIYDVWKNRKRDYVGEIRRGELAIENDDAWALRWCCDYIWPSDILPHGAAQYYAQHRLVSGYWDDTRYTTLPTIKASELIKHLNK